MTQQNQTIDVDAELIGQLANHTPPQQKSKAKTESPFTKEAAAEWAYHVGAVAREQAQAAANQAIASAQVRVIKEVDPIGDAVRRMLLTFLVIGLHGSVTWVRPLLEIKQFNPLDPAGWLRLLVDKDGKTTPSTDNLESLGLDAEQQSVIADIVSVGDDLGLTDKDIEIAIATCLVETQCKEVDEANSDRDSQGAFQQRPSQDWPNTLDTAVQAAAFFQGHGTNKGLVDVSDRHSNPGAAAQAVQKSAYPERYQERMGEAAKILEAIRSGSSNDNADSGEELKKGDTVGSWTVTSGFGPRKSPTAGASSDHKGIDIDAPTGTVLYSVIDGRVDCFEQPGGYGIYAKWGGNNPGMVGHLSRCIPGEYSKGGAFAYTGNTGISTGAHADIRMGSEPNFSNPTRDFVEALLGVK